MEKSAKLKLLLLVAVVVIAAAVLFKVYISAASPSSVKVIVYQVEFMTDASDKKPQVLFSNSTGQEIDLTKDAGALVWQSNVAPGTYKRIRMTVANGIRISIANARDNPCGGAAFKDRVFPIADGKDLNSQQVSFATYDDGGGTWTGPRITHILLEPITVSETPTTKRKFGFSTANTLFCVSGNVDIRSPWAVWAEPL